MPTSPYAENKIVSTGRWQRGEALREFMLKQTRQSDVMLFSRPPRIDPPTPAAEVPFKVLVPSFVTSELKTAFQIGFLIFIPFPHHRHGGGQRADEPGHDDAQPGAGGLPFKLLLFVLADGWNLHRFSLAASFV